MCNERAKSAQARRGVLLGLDMVPKISFRKPLHRLRTATQKDWVAVKELN